MLSIIVSKYVLDGVTINNADKTMGWLVSSQPLSTLHFLSPPCIHHCTYAIVIVPAVQGMQCRWTGRGWIETERWESG